MALIHPHKDEDGNLVLIQNPTKATKGSTWYDHTVQATFTPHSFSPFEPAPFKPHDSVIDLQRAFIWDTSRDRAAAGAIVLHEDDRVWVVSPTNHFCYDNTFPKGGHDNISLDLQQTALREVYEESGLNVELIDILCDQRRGKSLIRWYLARYVSGCPTQMGWESQACHLVPIDMLKDFVERDSDKELADILLTWTEKRVAS